MRTLSLPRAALLSAGLCLGTACAPHRHAGGQAPDPTVSPTRSAAVASALRTVLSQAIADSAFPGAYAVVGSSRGVIAELGVGRLDADDAKQPDASTLWDLASLTKVIGTTSAMMTLVQKGAVVLDSPVVHYLPQWKARGAARITVRHLLTHSAGLPAWRPLYKEATTKAEALAVLYATSPDTVPGVRFLYSDLGFILLGQLVERVSGEPLAQYDTLHVFRPLGMTETQYLPKTEWLSRIAPTEIDPWRQRHIRGEVHDENAARLDGVSGHAGLFSTARDLTRFARMYLGYGALDGTRVIDSVTIATFTRVQDTTVSRRALGWETPTGGNSAGHRLSPVAFGHTGFTGTSLWMDPSQDLFVLLLTNRVNPTRQNLKISRVRTTLADAVVDSWRQSAATGVGASQPQ